MKVVFKKGFGGVININEMGFCVFDQVGMKA